MPLFNTNPGNANDADWYIRNDGALGIGVIGYSGTGAVSANTWYRVAFTADLALGVVSYYLDGNPIFTGTASLDGRHSLYSNVDPGADLLLFNEGDSSGVYSHEVYLGCLFITGRTLSAVEIQELGGPRAHGIVVPAPPILAAGSLQGDLLNLSWAGGEGPFQVQETSSLSSPTWANVGNPVIGTNRLMPHDGASGFFRISGQ